MEICTIPVMDAIGAGKYILYRPLAGLAFVGDGEMVNLARALADGDGNAAASSDAMDFLRAAGFLDPDPPQPLAPDGLFCPTCAGLLMTNRCHLRCTYCYAAAGEAARQELSTELGYAAIDIVCQNARGLGQPEFRVCFSGGGEPTLAWKTLQACTEYARRKPIPARVRLTSNGIWSPQQCDWILAHLDDVTLSMDGTRETQDRQRPFASGRGSSDLVLRTVHTLDRAGFPYAIRLTAAAPWSDLPGDVRFLCETTRRSVEIQVEPTFNVKRGGTPLPDEAKAQAFAERFAEAVEVARQAGRHLYYSGAWLGMVAATFCTSPYDDLIVKPNGDLVTCCLMSGYAHPLATLSTIGRIENGRAIVDEAARTHLHHLIAERRAACRDCFCYWTCAGDCYAVSFGSGPGGHLYRSARCEMNRTILQKLLLRGIAEGNGLWRGPEGGMITYGRLQGHGA